MIGWLLGCTAFEPAVVTGDLVLHDRGEVRAAEHVVEVLGSVVVRDAPLEVLDLPALERIGGALEIWESAALEAVTLPALQSVGGEVSLFALPRLADLDLPALGEIGGTLRLNRLPRLVDGRGLQGLVQVGGLYVYACDGLADLELVHLREVGGSLELWELPALEEVRLPALELIDERLDVFEADALTVLEAPQLTSLGAYELHTCDAMTGLGRFPAVAALPGELRVQYNEGLTSLTGFPALRGAGRATVRFNPALETTEALEVVRVEGELAVSNHRHLEALTLPALEEVRSLVINGHEMLEGLALPSLERVQAVRVVENPALSSCVVEALIERTEPEAVACGGNLTDGCTTWCGQVPP